MNNVIYKKENVVRLTTLQVYQRNNSKVLELNLIEDSCNIKIAGASLHKLRKRLEIQPHNQQLNI